MKFPASTEQLSLESKAKGVNFLQQQGKLRILNRLLGHKALDSHRKRTDANLAAEDAAVRRAMYGDVGGAESSEDMSQTILGDVTNPTPIVIHTQPQGSGIGKALVGAAIAVGFIGIPAAGIIGYGASQLMDKTPAETTGDNTLDIGLGRFEDLIE